MLKPSVRCKTIFTLFWGLLLTASVGRAEPRVTIDGADVRLDGQPHIPHGMVHVERDQLDTLRQMGINSLHIDLAFRDFDARKSQQENRAAIAHHKRMADEAHARGMTVLWLLSFHYLPDWLDERYPDAWMQQHDGSRGAGGWIEVSLNHAGFRAAAEAWLRFVVAELGDHPATLGWLLWNEPHLMGDVDYHWSTKTAFTDWLAARYTTIDALNEAWGMTYASFDAVAPPAPRPGNFWNQVYDKMVSGGDSEASASIDTPWHVAPPLWMDWMRFRQDNFNAFFTWEAGVIRQVDPDALITSKIVGFELYSSHGAGSGIRTDLWNHSFLDVVGMDLYPHLDENFLARWKCDFFRSLAPDKPIWNTECNFSFLKERGLPTPEQWRTSTYYQLARGVNGFWDFMWSDDIEYTLHYKGYKPAPVTREIEAVSRDLHKLAPILLGMRPEPARVAVLQSNTTLLAASGDYAPTADQSTIVDLLYRNQTPFDFVTEDMIRQGALSRYRALVTVGVVALPGDVLDAIERFTINHGGHVLANAGFAGRDELGHPRHPDDLAWLGVRPTAFHRGPRERTGTLKLAREARSVENKPIDVRVELATWSSKPITLHDGSVTASGTIYGDEDTQMDWSCGGRHELYWETIEPTAGGTVVGTFDDGSPAIVRTPQTLYIARDTCWVDDRFETLVRGWLRGSGVSPGSVAIDKATGQPAPHVDVRQWEGNGRRLLFIINSAPTLHYDGHPVEVNVVFDAYGDVSDALTGRPIASTWRDFKRIIPMSLEAGEVRVLRGEPYPTGWKHEQAGYDEVMRYGLNPPKPYRAIRRGDDELWVYDSRAEFGIGVHNAGDDRLELARRIGARVIRYTLYWDSVQTTDQPGQYNTQRLAEYDDVVRRAREQGLELLLVVHGNPPGTGWNSRHDSYIRFAHFLHDMAQRWPSVRYWELWNEMDVSFTDLFGAKRDGYPVFERGRCYAQMLQLAYPAIKRANPDAQVLIGGIASADPTDFIRGIYEGGGRESFDIMNMHTYGVPVVWSFVYRGYLARAAMAGYGDGDRPMWNTEFGINASATLSTGPGRTAAQLDADHLGQWQSCLEAAHKTRLYEKVLPYQLDSGNDGGVDLAAHGLELPPDHTIDDYGFGPLRRDRTTPRPTYDWLLKRRVNAPLMTTPVTTRDIEVACDGTWRPVGYACEFDEGTILIRGVSIDLDQPTVIKLEPTSTATAR